MARVFKLEMYIVDAEDTFRNWTPSQVAMEIKSVVDYENWTMSEVSSIQTSKEFEWDDNLDINRTIATLDDYEAYFKKEKE